MPKKTIDVTTPLTEDDIAIKGYTGHETSDGYAFVCAIHVRGVKTAIAEHEGNGGEPMFFVFDHPMMALLDAHIATLPDVSPYEGLEHLGPMKMDRELWLDQRLTQLELERARKREQARLKKLCQTKTVYRLPDGTEWVVEAPDSPKVRKYVLDRKPDAVFLNDQFV